MPQSVSDLWAWLHTWEDEKGGIHGPVVYHHRDNLKVLRPDTWTQGAAILGLLNVHRSSGDRAYLDAARRLGVFLVANYIKSLHVFRDSNFDQKPLGQPALEGNALASLSLLELGRALGSRGEELVETASDNVREFVVKQWDAARKSFAVTYHGEKARIHNKSAVAIMAILALEGDSPEGELTRRYAVPTADFIVGSQVRTGVLDGAFPYADNDRNYRTLYSLLTSLGLLGAYRVTKAEKYIRSVELLLANLSRFVDQKTGLICHYHQVGYPQWITDTILYHLVSRTVKGLRGSSVETGSVSSVEHVLGYQYSSGAFPLSIGFEDLWYKDVMRARPEIRRWRDVLPTPGLNAWDFWFLSSMLEPGEPLPASSAIFPFSAMSDREEEEGPYEFVETLDSIQLKQLPKEELKLLIRKCDDVPVVCRLQERGGYWKTIDSINRYPYPIRRLILAAPRVLMKLRR